MAHYGSVQARIKEGGSPVTLADHAANAAILQTLAAAFPGDAILSEEIGRLSGAARGGAGCGSWTRWTGPRSSWRRTASSRS